VLTAGKVRCSPSSPCSRARARCAWLRVAALLPSPPFRSVACALPGRTGKQACRSNWKAGLGTGWPDHAIALGIERDGDDRGPVAGLSGPAGWVALACLLVEFVARGEQCLVLAIVALCRGDIADATVAVLIVVPMHEARSPVSGGVAVGEPFAGNSGRYFAVRKKASAKALSSLTRGRSGTA